MQGSGIAAVATVGDAAIVLVSGAEQGGWTRLIMINESGIQGSFSVDGGKTYQHWPDTVKSIDIDPKLVRGDAIMFKRIAGGTDVTGLYAWGY